MKRRDVRFIEDLGDDTTNGTEENFETPLNSDWHKATNTPQQKPKIQFTPIETNKEEKEEEIETPKISIIASCRPKLLKTGKKGRPRKLYREITHKEEIESEPSSIKEIKNRTDKQA